MTNWAKVEKERLKFQSCSLVPWFETFTTTHHYHNIIVQNTYVH